MVKLLTKGAVILALVASITASEIKEDGKSAFFGWCPSLDIESDKIKKIPDDKFKLNSSWTNYTCDDFINPANEIAQEGPYQGQYIGYKGGACQFIKD